MRGTQARLDGLSQVAILPISIPPGRERAALLLGDTGNAVAVLQAGAAPIRLPGWSQAVRVSHVVSVADGRAARAVRAAANAADSGAPELCACFMSDWMRPDELVRIPADLSEPLEAIARAFASAPATTELGGEGEGGTLRAILVNCTLGYNRSPTLVLAHLLLSRFTLRAAYRALLRARPGVDPLPAYRHALRVCELERLGLSTVDPSEPFAMHISQQLLAAAQRQPAGGGGAESDVPLQRGQGPQASREGEGDGGELSQLGGTYAKLERSVAALIAERDDPPIHLPIIWANGTATMRAWP
jgi:hypothetical protein